MTGDEQFDLLRLRDRWSGEFAVGIEDGKWVAHPSYGPSRQPLVEDTAVLLDYAMAYAYTNLVRGGLFK